MYLHLGQEVVVRRQDIVGVFDIDNTTISPHTRDFLNRAEKEGRLTYVSYDLPRSFTVCAPKNMRRSDTVYVSQISPATLRKRSRNDSI